MFILDVKDINIQIKIYITKMQSTRALSILAPHTQFDSKTAAFWPKEKRNIPMGIHITTVYNLWRNICCIEFDILFFHIPTILFQLYPVTLEE